MADDPTPEALAARYAPVLREALAGLQASSEQTRDDRRPVSLDQQSVGRLSRIDALQGQAMANAMEARRAGRGRAIRAALERIEEGEFGFCEDCGEFIGWKRLDLDPTTPRCVGCAG